MVMVKTFFFVFTLSSSFFLISMDRSYSRIRLPKRNSLSLITTSISEEFSRLRDQPSPLRNSSPKPVSRESSPRISKKNPEKPSHDSPPLARALFASFIAAIRNDDMQEFSHYLNERFQIDINAPDFEGSTPLEIASREKKYSAMLALIKLPHCKADTTFAQGQTALHYACDFVPDSVKHLQLAIVQELIARKVPLETYNSQGQTPLHIAVSSSHNITLIQKLVRAGARNVPDLSPESTTPLDSAVSYAHFQWVYILMEAPDISQALIEQALKKCRHALLSMNQTEERKQALYHIEKFLESKKNLIVLLKKSSTL